MNPKIIFILSSISQPRCLRRIKGFMKAGYEVEIYGFNRGLYNVNAVIEGVTIHDLGLVPNGKGYLLKLYRAWTFLYPLFKQNKKRNIVYYSFAFDLSLLCKLFGRRQYIYEVSDLVYEYFNYSIIRSFFRLIDRWLIKHSLATVLTSAGFNEFLFANKRISNVIIQPNRVDSFFLNLKPSDKELDHEKLVFSYIGAFRYPNTVFRFAKIIGERYPQYSFHFYGDSMYTPIVKELSSKYKNVIYNGSFKNPEDLESIYKKIDIVVACYDTSTLNERVAEPNKLYEALYFKKPIIVSKNTFLERQIKHFGCGFSIKADEDACIIEFLDSLDILEIYRIKKSIHSISMNKIVDDDSKNIIQNISFLLN